MGTSAAKYANNGITNMAKELNIDVDLIISCQLKQLNGEQYDYYELDTTIIKNAIMLMNSCKFIDTNYIYNTKNRIILTLENGNQITLALSDCGKYVGVPTRASAMGLWFFLTDNEDQIFNPFIKFIDICKINRATSQAIDIY